MVLLPIAALSRPDPERFPTQLRFALPEDVCEVGEELGRGGFGRVSQATLLCDGRDCALKAVSKRSALGAEMARREVRVLQQLRDSHIVELLDAFEDDDNVYLVLELVEGMDLCEALRERGPLPERAARRLMLQLLQALAACHDKGFVHRDLKPENLVLRGDLHTGSLTLIDFGLALDCAPGDVVHADVAGTRGFLAPEGERGTFSYASDVFACGKVLERLVEASPAAADFLGALLQETAERRPSAAEALQHPWLQEDLEEISSQTECLGQAIRSPDACCNDETWSRSSTCGSLGELSICTGVSTVSHGWASEMDANEGSSLLLCNGIWVEEARVQLGTHCRHDGLEPTYERFRTIGVGGVVEQQVRRKLTAPGVAPEPDEFDAAAWWYRCA